MPKLILSHESNKELTTLSNDSKPLYWSVDLKYWVWPILTKIGIRKILNVSVDKSVRNVPVYGSNTHKITKNMYCLGNEINIRPKLEYSFISPK